MCSGVALITVHSDNFELAFFDSALIFERRFLNPALRYTEFEGPHFMPGLEGWEKIADHALEWALAHARPSTKVEA